ncbi:MAG: MoaD/ThiS family protein [Bacteroidota bacterium]
MSKIIIPTPLRKFTGSASTVEIGGATVKDAIVELTDIHPDLKQHLLDSDGNIRSFIRIFLGDTDILTLDSEQTELAEDSVLSIVPAIAGGLA